MEDTLFIVGGVVRDIIIGRKPNDIDVVAPLPMVEDVAHRLARKVGVAPVVLGADKAKRIFVLPTTPKIEVACIEGDSIEDDLLRRDFTINAMGFRVGIQDIVDFDPSFLGSGQGLIDPSGGQHDLSLRRIRMVNTHGFVDDPVRMLRCFRFAASLGFELDPDTVVAIERHTALLSRTSPERVWAELRKILGSDSCFSILQHPVMLRLLKVVIPEIAEMDGFSQGFGRHSHDLLGHTMRAGLWLDSALATDTTTMVGRSLTSDEKAMLRLAVLLHDVGKLRCRVISGGKTTFHNHENVSVDMVDVIAANLRWPNKEKQVVQKIIGLHRRPLFLCEEPQVSIRAMARLVRDAGDVLSLVLLHSLADSAGMSSALHPCHPWLLDFCRQAVEMAQSRCNTQSKPPAALLCGKDLIALGMKPGPFFRQVLEEVSLRQIEGTLTDKKQAIEFVIQMRGRPRSLGRGGIAQRR